MLAVLTGADKPPYTLIIRSGLAWPPERPYGGRMERQMTKISYYDASTESFVAHTGEVVRSGAGYTSGPEYGVLYRLDDGRYLGGVRHSDRGDLMTEVRYAARKRDAMPRRWR